MSDDAPFKDAETWLAERGVRREPIRLDPGSGGEGSTGEGSTGQPSAPGEEQRVPPGRAGPAAVTAREATGAAAQAQLDAAQRHGDEQALPDPEATGLGDDVSEALAFIRRSTAGAPQSEQRVAGKLRERGWAPPVVDRALDQARRQGIVDDAAMVGALVEERRAKGHAPARIRRDLRERGFADEQLDHALADADREDPEAAAFAVARDKAEHCGHLAAETAFRRVAAHVARRGYPEGLARKVAREAVFTAREQEQTAGH